MKVVVIIFTLLLSFSCNKDCPQLIDSTCYSFDIRQCQTDSFSDAVPETDTRSDREIKMKAWLESKNIFLEKIRLEISFHDAVCEACHVCPQGDRYFIQEFGGGNIYDLDLLNLAEETCCDIF
ncbi:MAG: hypothetical protein KJO29_13575 [Bacteroidia bacterium]|nr:hypothetical protein [Bacteroidia bacterium]